MRKILVATALAVASAMPTTPAHADTTLCSNNDGGEVWVPTGDDNGAGADLDEPGEVYVCVKTGLTGEQYQLVVIRPFGSQTVCVFYPPNTGCVVI